MNKSSAVYIPSSTPLSELSAHNYAESCELYQVFAEMTRLVARKVPLPPLRAGSASARSSPSTWPSATRASMWC